MRIEIRYAQKLGDSKIKLFWESDSQPFEIVKSENLYYKTNSEKTPFLFTVKSGATNETTTQLVDIDSYGFATVDVQQTQYIIAQDIFGNYQDNQQDKFFVTLTLNSNPNTVVEGVVTRTALNYKY